MDSIRKDIPEKYLYDYYNCYKSIYENYMVFSGYKEHEKITEAYRDSIDIAYGTPIVMWQETDLNEMHRIFSSIQEDTAEYSYISYYLAQHHERAGQLDSAKYYYTLSAISDIHCSNKNQGALIRLANLYFKDNEYDNAYLCSSSTIEDAIAGNMKMRIMRVSELFKIINDAYQTKEAESKKFIRISLLIIMLVSVVIFGMMLYIHKRNRIIKAAENEIKSAYSQLSEQNEILQKANSLQEKYISNFFETGSRHLSKMESFQHSMRKLLTSGRMDELHNELKSRDMLDNELQEQYRMFDKIFLDIYPTFIEEFTALLQPDKRNMLLKPGELMNTEMRIYALMRIGFSDCEKIASFLKCSLATVYTYRTKTRNRSGMSRKDFEEAVMKIGNIIKK